MFALVVVGGSLGGTEALRAILAALPADFPLPVAAVVHRGRGEEGLLARSLAAATLLPVVDVADQQELLPGRVYLAPLDYHLLVEFPQPAAPGTVGTYGQMLSLSTEAPINWARPAIDVLFESAAEVFGERVIGVLLSGLNSDGAAGLARIKEFGGLTVVQDPATAEAGEMPAAALALALAEHKVLSLAEIGPFLVECARVVK